MEVSTQIVRPVAVDSVVGMPYVSTVMQLQPRKVPQWLADWANSVEIKDGEPDQYPFLRQLAAAGIGRDLSIWRMELPNTSYRAPQAAFWWVSNEVKR
jgi:hypothetical protein